MRIGIAGGRGEWGFGVANDRECLALIRELISFMPGNNLEEAPRVATGDRPTA